ncbi:MAG: phosphate/phosphite/phosphonate ABC transporter substrate-binding protein [Brevefilum sp.]
MGFLSACAVTTPAATPTATPPFTSTSAPPLTQTQTPTFRPSSTATLSPLGTEGNPIKIAFILTPDETQAIDATEEIAIFLAEETGYFIEYLIYPDFQNLSDAILNGDVDFFWLNPLEYLYLHQAGAADVILMTNHLGVYAYGVQFMAHTERGFRSYFDPDTNESTLGADLALQQFSGTRPCYLSQESLPGYLVPHGLLLNGSIPTLDPVFVYNYSAIIRALFIRGICDFGVSYALTGDPRSASDILQNLPDAQSQIQVIWQSDGIIPNTNLSASTQIPLAIQHKIQEALLNLPNTPEGLVLLSQALRYDVEALKTVNDVFYQPFRSALAPLEIDLETLVFSPDEP